MCGLIGIIQDPRTPCNLRQLMSLLEHRGPDGAGSLSWSRDSLRRDPQDGEFSGRVLFGHHRLAVLDVSDHAKQPMSMDDGSLHMIYNGEVYNYKELRIELERAGYSFSSTGDSEVVLKAWHLWGAGALSRFKGMFAIGILDAREEKIYLSRDCFGIKPMYWTSWSGGFAFASEIAPLMELLGAAKCLDGQTVYDYLLYGVTEFSERTFVEQIRHVPPAHYMSVDVNSIEIDGPKRYWELAPREAHLSRKAAVSAIRDLFLENIRLHLRSDVPLGAALSGGIDSSAIVCGMRHLYPNLPIQTFSFVADDAALTEEPWIDTVVENANTIGHKVRIGPGDLWRELPSLIRRQGEPFVSTSIYAQARVFQSAKEAGIKVMIDGQGGDEIFGGYTSFPASRIADLFSGFKFPSAARLLWGSCAKGGVPWGRMAQFVGMNLLSEPLRRRARYLSGRNPEPGWLNLPWFKERNTQFRDFASRDLGRSRFQATHLWALRAYPLPMLLRYEDRNSMAVSIESRVPLLTADMAELAISLPPEWLVGPDGDTKSIFRDAMRGIVPDTVLDRRDKKGFVTPEKNWLSGNESWIRDLLTAGADLPIFARAALLRESELLLKPDAGLHPKLWRWVNIIQWCQQFNLQE